MKIYEVQADARGRIYLRTEDGTDSYMTVTDTLAEVNDAMMGGRSKVREMSSSQGHHVITYKDGRRVSLVEVDAPAPEGYAKGQAVVVQRPGQDPITGTVDHIHTAPGYVAVRDDRHRAVSNYPTRFVSAVETEEEPKEWATTHSGFTAHRFDTTTNRARCNRSWFANYYARENGYAARSYFAAENTYRLCPRCDASSAPTADER